MKPAVVIQIPALMTAAITQTQAYAPRVMFLFLTTQATIIYLAENLASWGYSVVSINANRGINCGGGVEKRLWAKPRSRQIEILQHLSRIFISGQLTVVRLPSIGFGSQGFVGKIDFTFCWAVRSFSRWRGSKSSLQSLFRLQAANGQQKFQDLPSKLL